MYYGGVNPELIWYLDGSEQETTVIFLSHGDITQMTFVAIACCLSILLYRLLPEHKASVLTCDAHMCIHYEYMYSYYMCDHSQAWIYC